jgi:hypothetical protein
MTTKTIAFALTTLMAACSTSGMPHATPASRTAVTCDGGSVTSDLELARYEGCTEVRGDLAISGVSSLEAMADLHRVEGTLSISETQRLYTLSGLESLAEVGALRIEHNRALINAHGLNGLTRAGAVVIAKNPRLSKRYGLLAKLSGSSTHLTITDNRGLMAEGVASAQTLVGTL